MSEQNQPIENQEQILRKKSKKKRFLIFILIILFLWIFNCYTIRINKYEVETSKINGSVRIAVISDLHASSWSISNSRIVSHIKDTEPDIVMILGDMYSRKSPWEKIQIPIELSTNLVNAGYPVYFVPGEHDTSEEYFSALSDAGVHVMRYKEEIINVKNNNIRILGIDNAYYSSTFDLSNAFDRTPDTFTVLMAHIPNYKAFSEFGADLTVCGDSHGGIIQLPFGLGPAYDAETSMWFPKLRNRNMPVYDKGLFNYKGGTMLVTSGLGLYPVPFRFNNRPEIAVIDIK